METTLTILGAIGITVAALTIAATVYVLGRHGAEIVWLLASRFVQGLPDVRWRVCAFHAGLGFAVSCLVAPKLPMALALAAGWTSTLIVAFVMHKLSTFEVKTPARSRVRSS